MNAVEIGIEHYIRGCRILGAEVVRHALANDTSSIEAIIRRAGKLGAELQIVREKLGSMQEMVRSATAEVRILRAKADALRAKVQTLEAARISEKRPPKLRAVTAERVAHEVAEYFGMIPGDMIGVPTFPRKARRGRSPTMIAARQTAAFIMRYGLGMSYGEIGKRLGNRDHTTVRSAADRVLYRWCSDQVVVAVRDCCANLGIEIRPVEEIRESVPPPRDPPPQGAPKYHARRGKDGRFEARDGVKPKKSPEQGAPQDSREVR